MSFIAPVLSIFGAVQSFGAAGQAREAGRANARRILDETGEEVRRKEISQEQFMGSSVAKGAASGVQVSGFQDYWDKLQGEFTNELDWMRKSGEQRAEIARKTGEYQATSGMAAGFSGLAGAASGGYTAGKDQGWWS